MDEYLKQLVMQRDTVILPEFGALETGYEPASIDYVQGKLYPPNKSLSFNANLRINDGTLIQHVQRAAQTGFPCRKTPRYGILSRKNAGVHKGEAKSTDYREGSGYVRDASIALPVNK